MIRWWLAIRKSSFRFITSCQSITIGVRRCRIRRKEVAFSKTEEEIDDQGIKNKVRKYKKIH